MMRKTLDWNLSRISKGRMEYKRLYENGAFFNKALWR
jgi:hypothetical protein